MARTLVELPVLSTVTTGELLLVRDDNDSLDKSTTVGFLANFLFSGDSGDDWTIHKSNPVLTINNDDGGVNAQRYFIESEHDVGGSILGLYTDALLFGISDDAISSKKYWLAVARTGNTIDDIIIGTDASKITFQCPISALLTISNTTSSLLQIQSSSSTFTASVGIQNAVNYWTVNTVATSGNFTIRDETGGATPFSIEPGAPVNSFYIDSNGNWGKNTTTPTYDVHLVNSSTNCFLITETESGASSTGFWMINPAHTWRVNLTASGQFGIVDQGAGNTVVAITAGAPDQSIAVSSVGGVYFSSLNSSAGNADARYNTSTNQLTYDTSARRLKTNERDYDGLIDIMQLKVKTYDRKDGSILNEIGLIADDVNEIYPDICYNAIINKKEIQKIKKQNNSLKFEWEKKCKKMKRENMKAPKEPSYLKVPDKIFQIEGYNKSDLVPILLYEIQRLRIDLDKIKK